MGAQRGRGVLLRVLSGALTAVFTAQGVVWAAPVQFPASGPSAPQVRFELPPAVALVDDRYAGTGDKFVVLIQDAHTNESGQMNLARALEKILPAENIRTVFTEAAAADSDVTPDALKAGSPAERERVGQAYLRKGLLSGSEYFSMTSDQDFRIIGSEDESLYREAGELFRSAADGRASAAKWLSRLSRTLEVLKSELWSAELKALDVQRERYRAGELALTDYFSALTEAAGASGLDLTGYPNLRFLLELKEREAGIDFKRAGEEELQAIKSLPADRREALSGLKKGYSPFRRTGTEARGTDGFFTALRDELSAAYPDAASRYPKLHAYFDYIVQSRRLNAPDALQELEAFEAAVWRSMAGSPDAAELEIFWQAAGRMQRIVDLKASPADLEAFLAQTAPHDPVFAAAWANRRLADLNRHFDFTLTLDTAFEGPFRTAVRFYRINGARDVVMADRILRHMEVSGEKRTVLITGGFHTPNLKRILKSRGVSYVSILPQVTHETDTVRYERLVRESLDEIGASGLPGRTGIEKDRSIIADHLMLPPMASRMATQRAIVEELQRSAAPDVRDRRTPGPDGGIRGALADRPRPAGDPGVSPFSDRPNVIPSSPGGSGDPGDPLPPFVLRRTAQPNREPDDKPSISPAGIAKTDPFESRPTITRGPSVVAAAARMSQLQQQGFTLPVRGSQEQFEGIDHEFGLKLTKITARPLNDQAKARSRTADHLDLTENGPDAIVYSSLLAAFYEAAAAANFTGLGKRDDVKTAADAAAVELGIRSYLAITSNNPNVAIVTFAAEGRKDGSVSQPLRSVFFKGAVKTENTFADMVKRIHELQEQGVTVFASKDDAVDNTNGLVNPNAVKLPGDSISIIGLIEIPKNWQRPGGPQTPFLVADEAIRMGGPTLSVPGASPETMRRIEARLTPFSGPKEILQVLTEEAGAGFDPNKVSFVILGTGDKQARHQQMISEAADPGFTAQYPGVKLITIPDGDPFPRILAAVGGELHDERHWIVIGRGGSTENILIMHALRTLASSTYVHTVVSAKGTDRNFSASNTDGRVRPGDAKKLISPDDAVRAREEARQEEFDIVQELRTPRGILQSPKLTPQDYAPGVLSLVSITGATPRYGAMEKLFHRITLVRAKKGDKKAHGTARGLITLQDGSAFAVDIRFTTEDYFRTRQDPMSASAVAQTHLDGLRPDIEEGFNRLITQAASQLPTGERWEERFREAQQAYENEDQFLLAADQLEQAYLEATRKRLFKDSTYQDDWVNLIGLLRGRPVSGARLARPAEAGASLTTLSRTSSAVILRPVSTAAVPTNLIGSFQRFAASAFLSGSAGDLEQLPIQIEGARFAVLQTSRVTPATVRVTVRGGGSEEVLLEPLRDELRQSRGRTQEPGWTADDEALTAFQTRENDLRDAIRAVAGKGLVEAYYRIPLGDLFPEALDGKPNLSADQVRDEIVILLSELAAFAESPDIGDRIQFYLDLENLSEANRAWLDRLVGQGRKTARFSQFHILSEKDPLPSRKLVFNWYVNEDHRDWNTDTNPARRVITGSHLRLAPTRPGLVQRWGVAVRIPVEALYAALPDASTTASAEVADRFVQAPNFSDQGLFYERSVRDGWFHRKAVFASAADLLVRVQGAEFFLDNQVASYLFIKDVGEWVSFVRRMRQKTATSV